MEKVKKLLIFKHLVFSFYHQGSVFKINEGILSSTVITSKTQWNSSHTYCDCDPL